MQVKLFVFFFKIIVYLCPQARRGAGKMRDKLVVQLHRLDVVRCLLRVAVGVCPVSCDCHDGTLSIVLPANIVGCNKEQVPYLRVKF